MLPDVSLKIGSSMEPLSAEIREQKAMHLHGMLSEIESTCKVRRAERARMNQCTQVFKLVVKLLVNIIEQ